MNFFNNIENKQLDQNQIDAITNNHNNNLVIAAAGSGKTTTIVGKVKYLVEIKNYNPEEILILSFTNASALEMKNRIYKEVKNKMNVMTFHKLGLSIIGDNFKLLDNGYQTLLTIITNLLKDENYLNDFIVYIYNIKLKDLILYKEKFKNEKYLILHFVEFCFTFLTLFKQSNFSLTKLTYVNKNKSYQNFIKLFIPIYNNYQTINKNNNLIDFNDMINIAITNIKNNLINLNYSYIIVDEAQDLSKSRYELINIIKTKCNSKLFCVGDDYQCIFSFAGSELDYFVNFNKYFGEYKKNYITKTYRFNQITVNVSNKFIKKNKKQLKKTIISNNSDNSKSIIFIKEESYKLILSKILSILDTLPYYSKIFFLGRYNNDLDIIKNYEFDIIYRTNIEIIYSKRVDLKIEFLTVHKSKGLEADYVFILNNLNTKMGFPSQKTTNEFLTIFKLNNEKYPFAEERRLFYVALTRAKRKTYLIVLNKFESCFIKELKKLI